MRVFPKGWNTRFLFPREKDAITYMMIVCYAIRSKNAIFSLGGRNRFFNKYKYKNIKQKTLFYHTTRQVLLPSPLEKEVQRAATHVRSFHMSKY